MAGIFGDDINSRVDFFVVLQRAKTPVAAVLRKRPSDPTLNSVKTQIDAVEAWTANSRKPTLAERGKIGMEYRMSREFEQDPDPEIQALTEDSSALQNYLRHWPDDAVARDPNNSGHQETA